MEVGKQESFAKIGNMGKAPVRKILRLLFYIVITGIIGYLLFLRYRLGLVRYFDSDEFAHLHWGYLFSIGERPYTDFFYFFPPFFLFPIAIIAKLVGRTPEMLIVSRAFIFWVFVITGIIFFFLARKARNTKVALTAMAVFAFLPLPYDKMLEVRPDLPALTFVLLGIYFFIKAWEKGKNYLFLLSGFCYSASLLVVPKTMFFLPVPAALLIFRMMKNRAKPVKELQGSIFPIILGGMIPAGIACILIAHYGKLLPVLSIMTRNANHIHQILGYSFYIWPNQFFSPVSAYYALYMYSLPWGLNLAVWLLSGLWAAVSLLSFLKHKDGTECVTELLMSTGLLVNLWAYIFYYPLKHAQYLIPAVPFAAYYFADLAGAVGRGMDRIKDRILEKTGIRAGQFLPLEGILILAVLLVILNANIMTHNVKKWWTNGNSLEYVRKVLKVIPPQEPVFDLSGEAVFYPSGYLHCCLPYGQYKDALRGYLPPLPQEMEKRKTKYVNAGGRDLSSISYAHLRYLEEEYEPMPDFKEIWVKRD